MKRMAVVTGGLGALGRAVTAKLVSDGWVVVIIDAAAPAATVAGQVKPVNVHAPVDLRSVASVEAVRNLIQSESQPICALVNIAGGFRWETLGDGAIATWDAMYETNLKTAVTACKVFLPALVASANSAIVNVGAASAARAAAGMGAYAASKSGVLRLTEALAEENKDRGVRVNAVLPGIIDTPANRQAMPDADVSRWVKPQMVAEVVAFLLSDAASGVTGAGVPVTGRL